MWTREHDDPVASVRPVAPHRRRGSLRASRWLVAALSAAGCASTTGDLSGAGDAASDATLDATVRPDATVFDAARDVVDVRDAVDARSTLPDAPRDVLFGDAVGCPAGFARCGAECVDFSSYVHHCGACGHDCDLLPGVRPYVGACRGGVCDVADACREGFGHCTESPDDGCETALSDEANCGSCGLRCPAGTLCVGYRTCRCAYGPGSFDQSQPLADGVVALAPGESVRQTFVARRSGVLTGLGLSIARCTTSVVTTSVTVTVFDDTGAALSPPYSAYTRTAVGCDGHGLDDDDGGVAVTIDLIPQCIRLVAGRRYAFTVGTRMLFEGVCDAASYRCTGGRYGSTCVADLDCASTLGISRAMAAPYPDGEATAPGATGAFDLTFRTYVR